MKPIKKDLLIPLVKIICTILSFIIAVGSAIFGITILLKEPKQSVQPSNTIFKYDTTNYKPKNKK